MGHKCSPTNLRALVFNLYFPQGSVLLWDPCLPPIPFLCPRCLWVAVGPPFIRGSELSLLNSFDLGSEVGPPAIPAAAPLWLQLPESESGAASRSQRAPLAPALASFLECCPAVSLPCWGGCPSPCLPVTSGFVWARGFHEEQRAGARKAQVPGFLTFPFARL